MRIVHDIMASELLQDHHTETRTNLGECFDLRLSKANARKLHAEMSRDAVRETGFDDDA